MRLIDADEFLEELKSSNISITGCNSRQNFKIINEVKNSIISMLSVQSTISEINEVEKISELKKCPFCGGDIHFIMVGNGCFCNGVKFYFEIECSKCKIKIPKRYKVVFTLDNNGKIKTVCDERQEAIEKWNKRA